MARRDLERRRIGLGGKVARPSQHPLSLRTVGASLAVATVLGFGYGAAGSTGLLSSTREVATSATVSLGLQRARPPQQGDYWRRCDEARAAGTAPIYLGEPGSRDAMDGDGDGSACEPYPGP